ncbi:hypothetical protein DDA93_09090 [Arthrobacter sp. Bz4]|nr:hypothetical protein DDA93_09090 [Arthrobacter sp. Bz4]
MLVFTGAIGMVMDPSRGALWFAIAAGVLFVAIATRGPWDSKASGRNRSVLGFKALNDRTGSAS